MHAGEGEGSSLGSWRSPPDHVPERDHGFVDAVAVTPPVVRAGRRLDARELGRARGRAVDVGHREVGERERAARAARPLRVRGAGGLVPVRATREQRHADRAHAAPALGRVLGAGVVGIAGEHGVVRRGTVHSLASISWLLFRSMPYSACRLIMPSATSTGAMPPKRVSDIDQPVRGRVRRRRDPPLQPARLLAEVEHEPGGGREDRGRPCHVLVEPRRRRRRRVQRLPGVEGVVAVVADFGRERRRPVGDLDQRAFRRRSRGRGRSPVRSRMSP